MSEKAETSKEKKKKRKGALRENIESIAVAIIIALLVRHFIVEAFKIPTGSMAPTLLGMHTNIVCPNCSYRFALNLRQHTGVCPNCLAWVSDDEDGIKPWLVQTVFHDICETLCRIVTFGRVPTLEWHGQNRILVNKFIYDFKRPDRWDVIVFLYPLRTVVCRECGFTGEFAPEDVPRTCPRCRSERLKLQKRKNFIKRLVGLPGEVIEIIDGDIYVNGKIARKPERIQKALWQHVYDSRYVEKRPQLAGGQWLAEDSRWHVGANEFTFDAREQENRPARLRFQRIIKDRSSYSGGGGMNPVGDIMVEFDLEFVENRGDLAVTIREDDHEYVCTLECGAKPALGVKAQGEAIQVSSETPIQAGRTYHVAFCNVDDSVSAWLDGERVVRKEFDAAPSYRIEHTNGVSLTADGGRLTVTNLTIKRDVYYTFDASARFPEKGKRIPKDHYLALGDNSPTSRDSRVWGYVPAGNLLGKAFMVFWPPSDIKLIK